MTALDWAALGLLLFIADGIILAFFLYLRTAHRKGGWKRVRTDFVIAVIALLVFVVLRIWENDGIQSFKHAAERGFR